jgi:hypothetical protein
VRFLLATTALSVSLLLSACGGTVLATVPEVEVAPTDVLTLNFNGQTLSIELPASPTPASYGLGYNFTVQAMATLSTGDTCKDGLEFYTNPMGGGGFADSCIEGLAPYIDPGVQLFTGSVTEPTFIPGTYNFNVGGLAGVLTIIRQTVTPALSPTVGTRHD